MEQSKFSVITREEKYGIISIKKEDNLNDGLKCLMCDVVFPTKNRLEQHISEVHKGNRTFKCTVCDKKFGQSGSMMIHISAVHKDIKPFKCSTCLKAFPQKSRMKLHIRRVHAGM